MRTVLISLTFFVLAATPAAGYVPHVVQPGETLWGIAAANNFPARALAAANGLSVDSPVVAGTTIKIPTVAEAAAALQGAPAATAAGEEVAEAAAAPKPMGGYIVQPGDTLSGLAARSGVSVQQMAFMNGLDPNAYLIVGTPLKLPTGAPIPTTSAPPEAVVAAAPAPTPGRGTPADI